MDRLRRLYSQALTYPKCLTGVNNFPYIVDIYYRELDKRSSNLFCSAARAHVELWQYRESATQFVKDDLKSGADVERELGPAQLRNYSMDQVQREPAARYIFMLAPHSLDRLKITKDMFTKIFTYLQVTMSFLDFVFCFGSADNPQEGFYYGGFREECSLSQNGNRPEIPALGRSGIDIQVCYSLRSADFRPRDSKWSIKQTAIYHSLDMATGTANWIMLRGDKAMKERVTSAIGSQGLSHLKTFKSLGDRLVAALSTHLLLCDMSTENWRWFVDDLQKQVQNKSLAAHDESAPTTPTLPTALSRSFTFTGDPPDRVQTYPLPQSRIGGPVRRVTDLFRASQKPSPSQTVDMTEIPIKGSNPSLANMVTEAAQNVVSFDRLQDIEALEERVNAALLVVKTNHSTIAQLSGFYETLRNRCDLPSVWGTDHLEPVRRFTAHLEGLQCELQHQRARMETLLRMLGDRKALMHGIIQFRTASKMEEMTADMAEVARKTQQETVSMKIITLVTLFFLPGTFISTLMSTDIVRFQRGEEPAGPARKMFSPEALELFFEICGPLMLVTFLAWGVFYWWVYRRQRRRLNDEWAP